MQQAQQNLEYEKNILAEGSRKAPEDKFILSILTNHFFVNIVSSRERYVNGRITKTYILGTDTNVQIATYVYGYLKITYKKLFKEYKKVTGCPASARQSYYCGLMQGLSEQLAKTRKQTEQETGLVVVRDSGLEKYMRDAFPRLKSKSSSTSIRDKTALNTGRKDGEKIRISKGIQSSGESGLLLK